MILYVHNVTALGKGKQYREEIKLTLYGKQLSQCSISQVEIGVVNAQWKSDSREWYVKYRIWSTDPNTSSNHAKTLQAVTSRSLFTPYGLWNAKNICEYGKSEIRTLKDTQTRSSHLGWTVNNPRKESRDFSIRKDQTKLKICLLYTSDAADE